MRRGNDMLSSLRSCEFQAAEQLNQQADTPGEEKELKSLCRRRCFDRKRCKRGMRGVCFDSSTVGRFCAAARRMTLVYTVSSKRPGLHPAIPAYLNEK